MEEGVKVINSPRLSRTSLSDRAGTVLTVLREKDQVDLGTGIEHVHNYKVYEHEVHDCETGPPLFRVAEESGLYSR
jgi:hypothetical protein